MESGAASAGHLRSMQIGARAHRFPTDNLTNALLDIARAGPKSEIPFWLAAKSKNISMQIVQNAKYSMCAKSECVHVDKVPTGFTSILDSYYSLAKL